MWTGTSTAPARSRSGAWAISELMASAPQPRAGSRLAAFGGMGAFGLPPVSNLLRALPVLDVTDNRRLTLWVAFALVLLQR